MNIRLIATPLACLIGLSCAAAKPKEMDLKRMTPVAADQVIPATDFFRPAYMADPTLNRKGDRIAAMASGGKSRYKLMVINRVDGTYEIVSGEDNMDVYSPWWLSNDHVSYKLSREDYGLIALMVVEVGHWGNSYPIQQYGDPRIIDVPFDQPMFPLVHLRNRLGRLSDGLVQLDARRSKGDLIRLWDNGLYGLAWAKVRKMNQKYITKSYPQPKRGQVIGYMADWNGHLALAWTKKDGITKAHYWTGDAWALSPLDLDEWAVAAAGNTPGEFVVRERQRKRHPGALYFANVVTGEIGEMILDDKEYDIIGRFYYDRNTKKLAGVGYDAPWPRSVWFDKKSAAVQKALEARFPGRAAVVMDMNEGRNVFIVRVSSDRHPRAFYTLDLEKNSLDLIAKSRPWLDPQRMRPIRIVKYKTAEGHKLDAYLTLPEGASKESPPPLIVLLDRFSEAKDWEFNEKTQFWASRGYAVLHPRYRGSSVYDSLFSGKEEWDLLKINDDVTRAVRTLVASGLVDGTRVAIAGDHFGGYLALMGMVSESDLYQCAVVRDGVFDWEGVLETSRAYRYDSTHYQTASRYMGDPKSNPALYDRISPGRHVDRIKAPVFIAYRNFDGRDSRSTRQSLKLAADLKEHHIEREVFVFEDDSDANATLRYEVKYYNAAAAFLKKHL